MMLFFSKNPKKFFLDMIFIFKLFHIKR